MFDSSQAYSRPDLSTLSLHGGRLVLDFVNSIDPRDEQPATDYLVDYDAFVEWGVIVNLLNPVQSVELIRLAKSDPAEADKAFKRAIELREGLYRVFIAAAKGIEPHAKDLALLTRVLKQQEAIEQLELNGAEAGPLLKWDTPEFTTLKSPLYDIARDALQLLTEEDARRLGTCEHTGCGWVFFDDTKNRTRRWCSMPGCGSIEKARRLTERRRAQRAAA